MSDQNPTTESFLKSISELRIGELSPLDALTKLYELQRTAKALLSAVKDDSDYDYEAYIEARNEARWASLDAQQAIRDDKAFEAENGVVLPAPEAPAAVAPKPVKLTTKQYEILHQLVSSVIIEWWTPSGTSVLLFPAKGAWKGLMWYRKADSIGKVNAFVFDNLLQKGLIEIKRSGTKDRAHLKHYEISIAGRAALEDK